MKLYSVLASAISATLTSYSDVTFITDLDATIDLASDYQQRLYEKFLIDALQDVASVAVSTVVDVNIQKLVETTAAIQVIFEGEANANVVSNYFNDNVKFEDDEQFHLFVMENNVEFPEPGPLHGSCAENASECRKMTISSNICFNRDDIDSAAEFSSLALDYKNLNLFNETPGFIISDLTVEAIKPNFNDEDTEEMNTSKGTEGESLWFRFNFVEQISDGTFNVCGEIETVFNEIHGDDVRTNVNWIEQVNAVYSEALNNTVAVTNSVKGDYLCTTKIYCEPPPTEPPTTQPPATTTPKPTTTTPKPVTTTLPGPVTTEDPWSEAVCKGANKPDYFVTNESSKLIRQGNGTYLVRLLMGGVPETTPYTGLFVVSKKKCGKNFVEALNSRQIQLFMLDNYDSYELEHHYMSSGSHQNVVFQFRNDPTNCNNINEALGGPKGCIGNPNRDVADVFFIGAKDVEMGNKKIRDCIEGIRVGYAGADGAATLVNENITPCVSWTQKFWG